MKNEPTRRSTPIRTPPLVFILDLFRYSVYCNNLIVGALMFNVYTRNCTEARILFNKNNKIVKYINSVLHSKKSFESKSIILEKNKMTSVRGAVDDNAFCIDNNLWSDARQ